MKKSPLLYSLILAIIFLTSCAPQITEQAQQNTSRAEKGDLVTINYVLSLQNGTVVDTTDVSIAEKYGLQNYVKGSYSFVLGQSGKVKGFDDAILGMQPGEKKEAIIEPTEKEIILKVNKTSRKPRFKAIQRRQIVPQKTFKRAFGKEAIIGDIVRTERIPWPYKVVNKTNEEVQLTMWVKKNETYQVEPDQWNSTVFEVYEKKVSFKAEPKNQTIQTPFGTATATASGVWVNILYKPVLGQVFEKPIDMAPGFSITQKFQVTNITEQDFTIKRVGILADKRLKLNVELVGLEKNIKEVS